MVNVTRGEPVLLDEWHLRLFVEASLAAAPAEALRAQIEVAFGRWLVELRQRLAATEIVRIDVER